MTDDDQTAAVWAASTCVRLTPFLDRVPPGTRRATSPSAAVIAGFVMHNGFQARVTVRISMLIILVLTPFLLYHAHRTHWRIAALLGVILIGETLLIHFVNNGGSPRVATHVVSLTYSAGALYVVHVMGVPGTFWLYPVVLANFYVLPWQSASLYNVVVIAAAGVLMRDQPEVAVRLAATLGIMTLFGYVFVRQVSGQRRELSDLSLIDPLTRALNRRALDDRLAQVAKEKARHDGQVSAIMLDIDHFKKINDRFDHHTGDAVLKHVVDAIKLRLRGTDSLYRYGGEEFVVIAMHTRLDEAESLAEDLRRKVNAAAVPTIGHVTVSAGVAELQADEQPMAWISRADEALYQAKKAGRNRVCIREAPTAVAG
ncbi:MAG: GGDEF domain-containing protein [Gammaproteobacteria bacterium]|nr:GGDEF domain-containing protein [Gammaproteobacteria bacterium]